MSAADFSKSEASNPDGAWIELQDQVLVRVSGPGTDKFLHGQFSQNLDDVTANNSPRAAAATPKGRAFALVRLVRHGDDILFNLPASSADPILSHLNKYLMLFRGTEMSVEPDGRLLGIIGTPLAEALQSGAAHKLDRAGATMSLGNHRLIRTQDTAEGLSRFEFWQLEPLDEALADVFTPERQGTQSQWRASEIAAGVAALDPETREKYVPQMLNWQHLDGLHFNKGCYTGQEVIARMHFLGQLKKSLFRLRAESRETAPASGTPVMAESRPAGEVVNAVSLPDGSVEMLAVLRHDSVNSSLTLGDTDTPVALLPLPYIVTERDGGATADT
ncbi:YgfZ/GcvT domain-containing protein [Marinobacter salicampi]|uniref:CAF17-like 4Fe-4S cluster assembly/insertion protein YgfZ n=1 Tax=Marinobacter salicampi TaxID=435907 RepID=UPI001409492C|nr:folate-binding protein YgfZ [Marinobacter salicampi]